MSKRKVWNLYEDANISSLKNIFNIYKTEDIEEFWLFFQENSKIKNEEVVYIIVKYLFTYTSKFLTKVESFDVILEYTKDTQYITFWHQGHNNMLQKTYIELKNYNYFNLILNEDRATFQIVKTKEICPEMEKEEVDILTSKEVIVYDFLNKDDLISMHEINDELLNQMFYISSIQVNEKKIATIVSELDAYMSIFNKYKELIEISLIILEFRDLLENNIDIIIQNPNADLNILFEGVIANLKKWTESSFVTGIENINYYNASLSSDIAMIARFLTLDEETNFDEDIFF